jgi:hypothetical protein
MDFKRYQGLCAQKVVLWRKREWLAVRDLGPRSLSNALAVRTMGKHSGRQELLGGLALNRYQGCYTTRLGIKDLHFGSGALSRPTWHYEKAPRSQRAQCPIAT